MTTGSSTSGYMEKCPTCTTAIASANDQFCRKCGARLFLECSKCQKPVRRGDIYCANCGRRRYFFIEALRNERETLLTVAIIATVVVGYAALYSVVRGRHRY